MLYLDFETYNSKKDIGAGTYEYARTAEVLLASWAIDDQPAQVWDATTDAPMPGELAQRLRDPAESIVAHNAMFDRNILLGALGIRTDARRWRCTMIKAMTHGFPGSLDQIGRILGLPPDQAKLTSGKSLINRFCKPAPKNHKAERYSRETHPDLWAQFRDYARRDVEAMREIDRRLPDWNDDWPEYHLDQAINDRGFCADVALVGAGAQAAIDEGERLARRFVELTGGAVERPTQRETFRLYLNRTFGLDLRNTQAQTFKDRVAAGGLPDAAKELMQIAIQSNKTSTAKYAALAPALSPDGRFRGGLQFAGATRTRRWAGRVFQPHNLPSRGLPPAPEIDAYIDALKAGVHDCLFDNLMLLGSAALRGIVIAPPGKKLVVADLSNIEGRVNAWLAGENWKLKAFAAFDRGEGPDLYKVTAAQILGKTPDDVTKTERNVFGKVPELALGYEGGVGAFQTFSNSYGVKMADHWATIRQSLAPFAGTAQTNYDLWGAERSDAAPDEWIASETVKLAWRARHPAISRLWRACKDAATRALEDSSAAYAAGRLKFRAVAKAGRRYLLVRLPSNKHLVYCDPALEDGNLSYWAVDGLTRQWTEQYTYGGKLVENACQSLSRDVLAQSMARIEAAGYRIVLTVHDEIITEAPDEPAYNADRLAALMAERPVWGDSFSSHGLPLAAAGFEAHRYRKE